MSSLLAGIKIVSQKAQPKNKSSTQPRPSLQHKREHRTHGDVIELDQKNTVSINTSEVPTASGSSQTPERAHDDDVRTPQTPNELEASQPPTPIQAEAASIVPSWSYPSMSKWRVLSCCLVYLSNGMNDSAPGALIPYIEAHYSIGYATVSLIWIANAAGFILAACVADLLLARLGRARAAMASEALTMAGYVMAACEPPFGAVAAAYFVLGVGIALNLALNNVYCANLANSTVILGAAHGSYGIGGVVAPIAATAMLSAGVPWARFYLITLGLRCVCLGFAGWAFWGYEREGLNQFANGLQQVARDQAAAAAGGKERSKLRTFWRAIGNRTTLIGALFIFAYQGAEVSESGWFIQYLISYRHGDPARVGYVTSGFWAGITLGRFVLTHLARRTGEKSFVFAMGVGVIGFQIMAWLIPDIIGSAIAVSILGLLLGPVYPCVATIFTKLLPGNDQTTAIGFISSAGSSGGAVVPFITGLIAQGAGTSVLHPICIASYVVMLVSLMLLPRVPKRRE